MPSWCGPQFSSLFFDFEEGSKTTESKIILLSAVARNKYYMRNVLIIYSAGVVS